MPFGKRFRFGGNAPTAIGIGDGEANLDELAGQKHKDFSHLSGGSGKVELYAIRARYYSANIYLLTIVDLAVKLRLDQCRKRQR